MSLREPKLPRINWHSYHDSEVQDETMVEIVGYEKKEGYYSDDGVYREPIYEKKTFYIPEETLYELGKKLLSQLGPEIARRYNNR